MLAGYTRPCFWFELMDIVHKLILTAILGVFTQQAQLIVGMVRCLLSMSSNQPFIAQLVATAYLDAILLLQVHSQPIDPQPPMASQCLSGLFFCSPTCA